MALQIVKYRKIYKDPRHYCGPGPSVVVDGGGDLLVAFRRVGSWLSEGHVGHWHPATESCLTRSADDGDSWSQPQVFLAGYQCPCLARLEDGTLIHSTHRMELVTPAIAAACGQRPGVRAEPWPSIHAGTAIWRSVDGGDTWSAPSLLGGVPGVEPLHPALPQPLAVRGNVLETSDGHLLISAYDLKRPNSAYLFASDDWGRNWAYRGLIAAGFNETFLFQTAAGDLLAFMRAADAAQDPQVFCARSTDWGRSWSPAKPVCRGYPACAVGLPSGKVLLAYGFRLDGAFGVRARLLSADGERLDDEQWVVRADGATADLGYPDAALLPDGRVVVVYYHNSKEDAADQTAPRYIEGCWLEESV